MKDAIIHKGDHTITKYNYKNVSWMGEGRVTRMLNVCVY